MTEIIAKKTGTQLIVLFSVLLLNMVIQFNIWSSLRYDDSTLGTDEEAMLLKLLISQAAIVPFIIILSIVLVSLAYNNKIEAFSEPGSAMLNISLLIGLLMCIASGSVTGYIAYKLQCVDLHKTVWLNLLFSTILTLGTAIFIILLQISDRAAPLLEGLTRETRTEQALQAIEEIKQPQQELQRLASITGGLADASSIQRVFRAEKAQQQESRAAKEAAIMGTTYKPQVSQEPIFGVESTTASAPPPAYQQQRRF